MQQDSYQAHIDRVAKAHVAGPVAQEVRTVAAADTAVPHIAAGRAVADIVDTEAAPRTVVQQRFPEAFRTVLAGPAWQVADYASQSRHQAGCRRADNPAAARASPARVADKVAEASEALRTEPGD